MNDLFVHNIITVVRLPIRVCLCSRVTVDMFKNQMEHARTTLAYEKKSR